MRTDLVVEAAQLQTGLEDAGDPDALEGLDRLIDAVSREARLNDLGNLAVEGALSAAWSNRLKVIDHVKRHPELTMHPVERPVVVVGMFRAGTTLLSNLLDLDPANRSLLRWESGDSVPPPEPVERRRGPRVQAAQAGSDMLEALNPRMRAIHHEDADSPTECIAVLGQAFRSISWEAMVNVPSYAAWWRSGDCAPAYAYHRQVLQLLQSNGTTGQWTLKSPHHALALDALVDCYPDAQLVLLHRDPVQLVTSVCSLVTTMSSTFSDHDHGDYIREHWTDTLESCIHRVDDFRARRPEHPLLDLQYDDLVADPVGVLERLYGWLGRTLDGPVVDAVHHYLDRRSRGALGEHRYRPEDHGLLVPELRERFAGYVERYGVTEHQALRA